MLFDKDLLMSDGQVITDSSAYAMIPSSAIDLKQALPRQIGSGHIIRVALVVTTAFVGDGMSWVATLVNDDNVSLASNPVSLATTGVVTDADDWFVLGRSYTWTIPYKPELLLQYIGITYTCSVAACTAGAVTAGVVVDHDSVVNGTWVGVAANTGF